MKKVAVFDNGYAIINSIKERLESTIEFDLNYESSFLKTKFKIDENEKEAIDFKENTDNYQVVIINLEAHFGSNTINYEKVVEIIFRLRIQYNFGKPIILMGFQSLLSVLKQLPKATVLNATNVYFVDILSDLSQLDNILNNDIALNKTQIRNEYLVHAKNYFDLTTVRHEEANWFCVKILYNYYNKRNKENIEYPDKLTEKLNELNYILAKFIYLEKEIQIEEEKLIKNNLGVNDLQLIKEKLIKVQEEKGNLLNNGLKSIDNWCKKYKISKNDLESINFSRLEENNPFIISDFNSAKRNQKIADNKLVLFNSQIIEFEETIKKMELKNINVLLIDDQSNDGFYTIYKKILNNQELFNIDINIDEGDSDFNFEEAIMQLSLDCEKKITDEKIDTILLDLNLFPNHDKDKNLEKKSGINLLNFIKTKFPWIPIIITSASNKIWTINKISQLKADAYWIKEGLDNNWHQNESYLNYIRFSNLVKSTKSIEFKALKILFEILEYIETPNNQWWKSGKWMNGDDKNSDTDLIKDCLLKTINQLIRHCRDFVMNFNYLEKNEESKISLASIFNNIGIITEAVLNVDFDNYNKNKSAYLKKTPFYPLEEISFLRNKGSHITFLETSTENIFNICKLLKEFITKPINYLETLPENLEFNHSYIAEITNIKTDCYPKILEITLITPSKHSFNGYIYINSKFDTSYFKEKEKIVVTPTFQQNFFMFSKNYNDKILLKKKKENTEFNLKFFYYKLNKIQGDGRYSIINEKDTKIENVLIHKGDIPDDTFLVGSLNKQNSLLKL